MDIATPAGIVVAFAVTGVAIALGGDFGQFVDIPSVFIVFGGTIAVTLVRFTLQSVTSTLMLGFGTAMNTTRIRPQDLIDEGLELCRLFRQRGPLALETVKVRNQVLEKGVAMIAIGFPEDVIRAAMDGDRDRTVERLSEGVRIFRAMGDAAPAFGMIGTLVGLVQMLATMDDPSTIGPSMAVALLTTLYGALISNVVALPLADKIDSRIGEEYLARSLAGDLLCGIIKGGNPDMLRDQLEVYLPPSERARPDA